MKEARRRAIRIEAEILEGRYAKPMRAPSVADVIAAFLKHKRAEVKAVKTLQKYELVAGRVRDLADRRKAKTILDVNIQFVDAYVAEAAARKPKPAEPKTLSNELVIVRQFVNFALSRDMIGTDPLRGLKLKKAKSKTQPCWTLDQIERILGECNEPQKSSLVLLAETGMRFGELAWLTWDDVDFEVGVLHIREKEGWKPKTGDRRAIPMSQVVREVLERLPRSARWVVMAPPSERYPEGGNQISERRLLTYLKCRLKRLRLRGHLHTFRNSFISNALIKGIPQAVVRSWAGHVDEDIIKLYTHIADEASRQAMRRLGDANDVHRQLAVEARASKDSDLAQFQHSERNRDHAENAKEQSSRT